MNTVTIEKTAKRFKLIKVLVALLIVADAIWFYSVNFSAELNSTSPDYTGPATLAAVTFALYVMNRIAIWWHHG